MRTDTTDTHPDAERVQIGLLRKASVARRVGLARSFSRMAIQLARRAIRRAHPEADEENVGLRFVSLHYGEELAGRLRAYLAAGPR